MAKGLRKNSRMGASYRVYFAPDINKDFKAIVKRQLGNNDSVFFSDSIGGTDNLDIPLIVFLAKSTSEFLSHISNLSRYCRVLVVAQPNYEMKDETALAILRAGASDVFTWNPNLDLKAELSSCFERWKLLDALVMSILVKDRVIGKSRIWSSILRQVVEVASQTSDSVLLTGETGTGKELIARLIYDLDNREPKGRYVILDCGAIVPELSGSEFFGHERGAFTGAVTSRDGAFALADGGTLFLDEIGELPTNLQAQLLRVIQEGYFRPVGSNTWRQTKFRLICATNKNLKNEVIEGKFRRDLYYQIANWIFTLPPLRERKEDITALARHFLSQVQPKGSVLTLDRPVEVFLQKRKYPGNIRELKSLISPLVRVLPRSQ